MSKNENSQIKEESLVSPNDDVAKSEFKKINEMTREEILALPRFKVQFLKIDNLVYGSSKFQAKLYLNENNPIVKSITELDYNYIHEVLGKFLSKKCQEVTNNKKVVTSVINTSELFSPCRFFKGVSKKSNNPYYQVQAIIRFKNDDYTIIETFFMKIREFKLFEIFQKTGKLQKLDWIENVLDEVIDVESEIYSSDDLF